MQSGAMPVISFFSRSILRRILASLVAIYIITYLATAILVYSSVRRSILESNSSSLNQLANLEYERLVNVIQALATDLTAWSELEVMNDLVSGDIDKRVTRALEALKQLYHLTGDIYAFDATGKLLASSRTVRTSREIDRLPAEWQSLEERLILLDKHTDPVTGGEVVAFEIPVLGSFDKNYRTGTLVLTYPWADVERLLFRPETGTILMETGGRARILAADPKSIADRAGLNSIRTEHGGLSDAFVVGVSGARDGLLANWQVVTLQETRVVTRSLRRVGGELALLGVILGMPIIALGRWFSRRLTAPVMELTRVVSEIADTDRLDARAPVSSSDELGVLARSFNRMTENLERATRERERFVRDLEALNQTLEAKVAARTEDLEAAIRAQQRLIGDISHEIKSPLARLSMALGLTRRSGQADAPKQFDRMEREIANVSALASELLTLARLDGAAASVEFREIDLGALVERIVADAIYEAPGRAGDVILRQADNPITIDGNADLLRRAIENVVRNAIFYTTENTPVAIILSLKTPELVSIEVRDHGPGVPVEALPHLFEPFYRVDEARARSTGGTGIGLSVCQRVVQLHGGSVRARTNHPHGLAVEIELPSIQPDARERQRAAR